MSTSGRAPCVVFYSFKGGTGKTLSAVQLGVALSSVGRRVCLVDFDLEAPGLALAIPILVRGVDPSQAASTLGLLDYIDDFSRDARRRGWLKTCESCGMLIPAVELDAGELSAELPPVASRADRVRCGEGDLLWIGAGRLARGQEGSSYWQKLASPEVRAVLDNNRWSAPLFEALLHRITVDLQVDYIVVDARSGINVLSEVCIHALADKLVLLTGLQEEAFYGTNEVLLRLQRARDDKPGQHGEKYRGPLPSEIFVVATRIPDKLTGETGEPVVIQRTHSGAPGRQPEYSWETKREKVKARINKDLRPPVDNVWILASAPDLQWEQRLPFPILAGALRSIVVSDYINLFAALLKKEEPDLRAALQPAARAALVLREYLLDQSGGTLINPSDGSANVAFKVSTFVTFLEALCSRIAETAGISGMSDADRRDVVDKALFEAGDEAATEFSSYLVNILFAGKEGSRESLWKEVETWCEFDSSVGFGRFEPQPWGTAGAEGRIIVHNNFLARDRGPDRPNLCALLRGYMTQVLNRIYAPAHVVVDHDLSRDCAQTTSARAGASSDCVFSFTVQRPQSLESAKTGS